jgi:hypothetical protein
MAIDCQSRVRPRKHERLLLKLRVICLQSHRDVAEDATLRVD